MAASPVTTAATLASTTSSVYERVAQTTVAWQNVSPWTQGRIPCIQLLDTRTQHMLLSACIKQL